LFQASAQPLMGCASFLLVLHLLLHYFCCNAATQWRPMGSSLQSKGMSDDAALTNRSTRATLMRKDSSTHAALAAINTSSRHRRADPETSSPCSLMEVAYCLMPFNSQDSEQENSILVIDKGPKTESGAIEVQMMKYSDDYKTFKEIKPFATGMHLAAGRNNNGMWCFLVDAEGNLVGVNSGVTKSGYLEVHRLSFAGAEPWQDFDLSVTTPENSRSLFEEWDFMLDMKSNLVIVKKGPLTPTARTEVFILKAKDDYASYKRTGAIGMHMTASMNHYGDWAFLLDGQDNLIALRRPSADEPAILVTRLTKASNWMETDLDMGGTILPQGKNNHEDVHWSFAMDTNDALLCIKEGPVTENDLTEIHRLTRESDYKNFSLHQLASAAPCRQPYFTDSDGR